MEVHPLNIKRNVLVSALSVIEPETHEIGPGRGVGPAADVRYASRGDWCYCCGQPGSAIHTRCSTFN